MKNETTLRKHHVDFFLALCTQRIRRREIKEWPKFCSTVIRTNSLYAYTGSLQTSILLPPSTFTWRFHYSRKSLFLLFPAFCTLIFPSFSFSFCCASFFRDNTSFTRTFTGQLSKFLISKKMLPNFFRGLDDDEIEKQTSITISKYICNMPPPVETNLMPPHKGMPVSTHFNL